MVPRVRRLRRMASAAAVRSPRTSVRSLASMATSVPVPREMPRSAWARAAASFTPSPTMATTRPSSLEPPNDVELPGREDLGHHLVDADGRGHRAGRRLVVAGEEHRPQAEGAQLVDRRRARRLHRVGHDEQRLRLRRPSPRPRPCGRPPRRRAGPRRARVAGSSTSQRADQGGPRPRRGRRPRPPRRGRGGWRSSRPAGAGRCDRRRPRPRRGRSGARWPPPARRPAAGPRSSSTPSATATPTRLMRPVVTVPVLSSTTVSTWRVLSSTSGPLMRMPSWAPRPVPTSRAVGVARPESAGAGDDQHGHGGRERVGGVAGHGEPDAERGEGEPDDHGHEHRRDAVGQPLHGSLARLGVLHEPGHLGQRRVGPDAGGAHDEAAAGVHGGTDHGVAGRHLDGHALPGHHRGVDRRAALHHHAVGRDLLARSNHEAVARRELPDRQPHLLRRRGAPPRPWRPARAGPAAPTRRGAWPWPRSTARPA